MLTSDSRQVVFIDSRVPDIADLINGVQPGVSVFALDPDSHDAQQIADILMANDLCDGARTLSATSVVSDGLLLAAAEQKVPQNDRR